MVTRCAVRSTRSHGTAEFREHQEDYRAPRSALLSHCATVLLSYRLSGSRTSNHRIGLDITHFDYLDSSLTNRYKNSNPS